MEGRPRQLLLEKSDLSSCHCAEGDLPCCPKMRAGFPRAAVLEVLVEKDQGSQKLEPATHGIMKTAGSRACSSRTRPLTVDCAHLNSAAMLKLNVSMYKLTP